MIFPLVGNDKINLSVSNFIAEKRIPHAILIEGEFGTGKHTLANFLATAIVCDSNSACGECKNCLSANSACHPDITVIAPEDNKKNISVLQIRQLREDAYIKPHSAKKKVFVIDCADTLNAQSQNALLKVLEEPPETVMFILIAESKASFLDTIISRCVVLTLNSPEFSVSAEYLKSKTDYDIQAIEQTLSSVKNNIGRAINVLKGKENSKTEAAAKEFFEFMIKGDQLSMLETFSKLGNKRAEVDRFIKDLKYLIANRVRLEPDGYISKKLVCFYNEIPSFEQSLVTNINLNLLFCAFVCKIMEIMWRNK